MKYQSVTPLKEYRDRLEAGEIVSAPKPGIRALRARSPQPAAFSPALDIEDRVLQVQRSVIRIMEGPHEVAAGLIVDEDGWAITKASLVGSRKQWSCRLFYTRDGKMIVKGRVVATSAEHDLALVETGCSGLAACALGRQASGRGDVRIDGPRANRGATSICDRGSRGMPGAGQAQ